MQIFSLGEKLKKTIFSKNEFFNIKNIFCQMKKIIIQVNKIIICLEIQSVKKVSVISETFHKLTIQKFSQKIVSITTKNQYFECL
jgi:hypothetical protein